MKIYDISQEVFECSVYPGDPVPEKRAVASMEKGDAYNLTLISMCAHNGTHIDAPAHFLADGKTVDAIPLSRTVGFAYVAEHRGDVTAEDAACILEDAARENREAASRILIKGDATVTEEAALVFAKAGVLLLGNESQTVGPANAPMCVHKILLSADTVLLEGIRLSGVPTGVYFLFAAPLLLGGTEGAPCRAVLVNPQELT